MNRIKTLVMSIALMIGFTAPAILPVAAYAATVDVRGNLCKGASLDPAGECEQQADGTLTTYIINIINIVSAFVGLIAVVMIIVGGIKYITSGGESGAVSGAKNTILYAIIGLIIVALSQVIVRFVINVLPDTTS